MPHVSEALDIGKEKFKNDSKVQGCLYLTIHAVWYKGWGKF